MTTPYVAYTATAGQTDFVVPFPYLSRVHVKVTVNGNPAEITAWPSSSILSISAVTTATTFVEIFRETPVEGALVEFQNGAVLTAEDLNTAMLQLLYRQQETSALYDRSLRPAQIRLAAAGGVPVSNSDLLDTLAQNLLQNALIDVLLDRIDGVGENAVLTQEILDRTSADRALTARIDTVNSTIGSISASVSAANAARIDGDNALAAQITTVNTNIGTVAASVTAANAARIAGDDVLAGQITTVNTTVGALSATVTTQAASINGLYARYGVDLDVNGYVTGFRQNNDGTTGSFVIVADRFAIVTPGVAPVVPFEVVGGIVKIKSAHIGRLSVGNLDSGTLDAVMNVGTGKIVYDNGTFMKVTGVGFGTASQFIEWFGPKMSINLCSESNAIQYLKVDGSAYFGGSLSAGTIYNSGSTSLLSNSSFTLGSFLSNGGTLTVVANTTALGIIQTNASSWPLSSEDSHTADPYAAAHTLYRSTYVIEKSSNGSAWSTVTTFTSEAMSQSRVVQVGMTAGAEPEPQMAWQHYFTLPATRTTSATVGSTTTGYLRITRQSTVKVSDGSAATLSQSSLQLSSSEQ